MQAVFYISNRTAITAETMGHSLLAQFPGTMFREITVPYIDTPEKAAAAIQQIRQVAGESSGLPLVISSLADPEIREIFLQCEKAIVLDLFDNFLPALSETLGIQPIHREGPSHRISNRGRYDSRIKAMNFTLLHDDGGYTRHYDQADIILVGVSRSGKTPTCIYLALQFSIRAANYPLTEDDVRSTNLPQILSGHVGKLYGLTTDPERLHQFRSERRPESRYASLAQCRSEIRAAEGLFLDHGIPFLNTGTRSIEEIATSIAQERGLRTPGLAG
ncbi:MAG: pyruvate, water dikinase regulatory protein [Pseudomonadota bacterium]|nr:pyruvate, water dikinase regulatory protein [Pseudomonadota bacterium]